MEFLSYLEEIPHRYITTVPYALPFVWAGAILGHSFIATPAKYNAPNLEHATAQEIGHATFTLFFIFEALFLAIITGTMVLSEVGPYLWFVFGLVLICLFLQRYYLKPIIYNKVDDYVHNRPLPTTFHRKFYSVLEAFKFLTLIGLGTLLIRY
ncbi:hypothetical protein NBRC116602_11450 [Hyphomicrobiales bacterium 4NK60-0047b]